MNIKVCGITEIKQLNQLDGLDIEFAGLIFYKDSSRYMKDKITGKELREADWDLKKVGVFVNAGYDEILAIIEEYELDVIQLHGDETPGFCKKLANEVELIRAFRINAGNEHTIDEMVQPYDDACDYYLFDTAGPRESFGGTGIQFDWNKLNDCRIEKPFFLSGGIGPDDVGRLDAFRHPDFFAVDINSKFEKSPGVKDMAKLLKFIKGLKG